MGNKLKFSSWLRPASSNTADAERKKQNRRSFSAFGSIPSLKNKDSADAVGSANGRPAAAAAAIPEKEDEAAPAAPKTDDMISLAKKITAETEKLEKYMREKGLPMPGFDIDAPSDFPALPEDVQRSRQEIVYATMKLGQLVRGPREGLRWGVWSFLDCLSLQLINHYGIAKLFPVDSTTTLVELQAKTSLDPVNLARCLRHAMTNQIFREPAPGVIAHTSASRLLAEDAALADWLGFNGEDIFPAAAKVLTALKKYPEATSLTRTGFNFAFDTVDQEPMFVTFGKDPPRAKRMGGAMASLTGGEGYEVSYFVDAYDFGEIDSRGGTLVDVGGSHGFVCVDLAKKWKGMKFVVQDLPKTVESAPKPISEDGQVAERIEFMAADFFKEQPVKDADVYYFRWIIHNYSTPYAVQILRNLVPALKPGARVIINDHCLREPGAENPWDEKIMRGMDMVMLALLNAQERDEAEFRALFAAADSRYVFKGVTRPKGCRMSIVEAVWQPEEVKAKEKTDEVASSATKAEEAPAAAETLNGVAKTADAEPATAAAATA